MLMGHMKSVVMGWADILAKLKIKPILGLDESWENGECMKVNSQMSRYNMGGLFKMIVLFLKDYLICRSLNLLERYFWQMELCRIFRHRQNTTYNKYQGIK